MTTLYKGMQASQCEAANAKTADFFTGLPKLVLGGVAGLFRTLVEWQKRHNERRQLAELDLHLLRDIGITEEDRQQELRKPVWRE
jgi:uncharacterized protein YjiS (DUF1127 family)